MLRSSSTRIMRTVRTVTHNFVRIDFTYSTVDELTLDNELKTLIN